MSVNVKICSYGIQRHVNSCSLVIVIIVTVVVIIVVAEISISSN